jgi:hypothetical protein
MTTEAQRAYMRDYMKKRRAAGLDSSRLPADRPRRNARGLAPPPPLTGTKLSNTLTAYSRSIGALERSAYLDALVLGKKPPQEMPPLASSQPVDQMTDAERRAQYRAELVPLVAAVEATFDSLPDLVGVADVLDRIDPALAAPVLVVSLHARAPLAVAATLKKLGAHPVEAGNTADGTRTRLYVIRGAKRYAGMKGRKLYAAYEAVKAATRSGATGAAVQRGSSRLAVGQRSAPIVNAGRGQSRKPSQSRRMEG